MSWNHLTHLKKSHTQTDPSVISTTHPNHFAQPTDLVSQCKTFAKHGESL